MFARVLVVLGLVLLVALGVAAFWVASRQNLRFAAAYPAIEASTDSAVVARGRYVVRHLADCAGCHGDPRQHQAYLDGAEPPLSGGKSWMIAPGIFYARNITPDRETGIGAIPGRAIARALRYGVGHDGRALLPFMEMQGLSDEDLVAVVSYLYAQPPVHHVVPPHRLNLFGRIVKATVLSRPVGPASRPPVATPRGPTVENGRYLVVSVAGCVACHTQRDHATGALTGPPLAGATGFEDPGTPGRSWSPPNITTGGRLAGMSEADFISRMRTGRAIVDSPMPWQALSRLDEDDLRAIYRYLVTVPASSQDMGPPVRGTRN